MEVYALRKLIEAGKLLYRENLVDARAGNLSYRLGEHMLITRRGSHLGLLQEWDFIEVPVEGKSPLEERASSELVVHRLIYLHTDHRSVVHAHPISAVLLSFHTDLIEPVDSEGRELLGYVRVIPHLPSGSEELAKAVSEALKERNLVVVRSHGVFSTDKDPFKAYSHISVLERSCRIVRKAL